MKTNTVDPNIVWRNNVIDDIAMMVAEGMSNATFDEALAALMPHLIPVQRQVAENYRPMVRDKVNYVLA